jgi:hypothetical protein
MPQLKLSLAAKFLNGMQLCNRFDQFGLGARVVYVGGAVSQGFFRRE